MLALIWTRACHYIGLLIAVRGRNLLKYRRGFSTATTAALIVIVLILCYLLFVRDSENAEAVFKWLIDLLRICGIVDAKFFEYIMKSPFAQLIVQIVTFTLIPIIAALTYYTTAITVGTTRRIIAWGRGMWKEQKTQRQTPVVGVGGVKPSILHRLARVGDSGPEVKGPTRGVSGQDKKPEAWKEMLRTNWWQLHETLVLTLEKGKLGELILEAKGLFPTEKRWEGSYVGLGRALGKNPTELSRIVNERIDSITVKNMKKLLKVMNMPYDALTPYIRSIGGKGSHDALVNPNLPFNLENPDGARLLAAALKDGDINCFHHFEYVNYDQQNLQLVEKSVKRIFGDIKPSILFEKNGREKGIKFYSRIIGDALIDAGAVVGKKTEQQYHLPNLIKYGDKEIKNAYFEQTIRDEGSVYRGKYRLTITGASEIGSKLTEEHMKFLDSLKWQKGYWPSGASKSFIPLREDTCKNLSEELRLAYEDLISKLSDEWIPPIIREEKEVLVETYGVEVVIKPMEIYKRKEENVKKEGGGLRCSWNLEVHGKVNVEKLLRQLGPLGRKGLREDD